VANKVWILSADVSAFWLSWKARLTFLDQFKIRTCWGENLAAETGDIARPSRKAGVNEGVASSTTFVQSPVRGRSSNWISTSTALHKKSTDGIRLATCTVGTNWECQSMPLNIIMRWNCKEVKSDRNLTAPVCAGRLLTARSTRWVEVITRRVGRSESSLAQLHLSF